MASALHCCTSLLYCLPQLGERGGEERRGAGEERSVSERAASGARPAPPARAGQQVRHAAGGSPSPLPSLAALRPSSTRSRPARRRRVSFAVLHFAVLHFAIVPWQRSGGCIGGSAHCTEQCSPPCPFSGFSCEQGVPSLAVPAPRGVSSTSRGRGRPVGPAEGWHRRTFRAFSGVSLAS